MTEDKQFKVMLASVFLVAGMFFGVAAFTVWNKARIRALGYRLEGFSMSTLDVLMGYNPWNCPAYYRKQETKKP